MPALAPVAQLPAGDVVDLGRGRTYVLDSGPSDGPTYILLHSLACTGLMTWYPALDMLSEIGRVVIFDQRCHGQGISPPRMLFEDCADDVVAVADVLDIPSFVPVGYSMGSLIAQLVWRRHTERVDGLVLCAATAAVSRARYERVATGLFAALIEALTPAPRPGEPAAAVAPPDASPTISGCSTRPAPRPRVALPARSLKWCASIRPRGSVISTSSQRWW